MMQLPSWKKNENPQTGRTKDLSHLFIMRSRLVIVFTLLYVTAFTIVSLVSYGVSKTFIIKDINIEVQEVLNAYAAEVDQWLKRMVSVVDANAFLIENGIPDESVSPELLSNISRDAFFNDMFYGTVSGIFISGKNWAPPEGYDPRTRPWFKSALSGRDAVIGNPFLDMETGSLAIPISSAVHNKDGTLRGVLSADLLLRQSVPNLRTYVSGGKALRQS
jgi:methyl-accepting chemotaxis protein